MADDPPSTSHIEAAALEHTRLFAHLAIADAYKLSAEEAQRRFGIKRTEEVDLTYGDVPFTALAHGLHAAAPRPGTLFCDLGSGVARGVLAAALLYKFSKCVGVELLTDLHAAAAEPAKRFESLREQCTISPSEPATTGFDARRIAACVELVNADLFDVNLADAATAAAATNPGDVLVFLCCVTWGPSLMQRLAAKLANELPNGSRVLTVGQRLPAFVDLGEAVEARAAEAGASTAKDKAAKLRGAVRFDEAWRGAEAFEWGSEAVVLHEVVRVGVLEARRLRKAAGTSKR